jgi:hypothetical protein
VTTPRTAFIVGATTTGDVKNNRGILWDMGNGENGVVNGVFIPFTTFTEILKAQNNNRLHRLPFTNLLLFVFTVVFLIYHLLE